MDSMTLYLYNDGSIEKMADVTIAVAQKDGTTLLQFPDDTRKSVDGEIFGAKPAGSVWVNTPREGPVQQWENVMYLMTYPHHIAVTTEKGYTFETSGRILRVASD